MATNCVNKFVIKRRSEELQPIQVGDTGGAEAAVHATRRLLSNLSDNHVFVKLDFSNTFNSVRRDTILTTVADKMPELYRFVHDSLGCNPKLIYGDNVIISTGGSQQGDPLTGILRVSPTDPTRERGTNHHGFVDDINLEGEISSIAGDIQAPSTRTL